MPAPSQPRFPDHLGTYLPRRTPLLRTDVLVIGGGIAGGAAALAAANDGASVVLLSKSEFTETNTSYAQGGMAAVFGASDSVDLHVADTLRVGYGLSDPGTARAIVTQGRGALEWLRDLGAEFDRAADGHLALFREAGHSVDRIVHAHGQATGAEIQNALSRRLTAHPNVTVRVGTFVRDLLVQDGRCVGGIFLEDGLELAVEAGAVILATGGAGQVYRETTNPIGACGDGMALAFRAGAVLADLEFVQFHPTTLYIAGASRALISEVVRGAGATLRDRRGHRFMSEVHPAMELAPRDIVSRAILERMVATGDTHVFLDLSTIQGDPHELFPTISRICRSFEIDIAKDPIPVRPGAHYFVGGVRSTTEGRTSLPGLFAVGEVSATGLHGANRLASNSLLEGAVMGRLAGPAAAAEARGSRHPGLPRSDRIVPVVENAPKLHLDDMLYSLKSMMWRQVGLRREGKGLADAVGSIALWSHYLERAPTRDRAACELANMLTVSALVATAAFAREESRGTHFRSDHPGRDDSRWCRRLMLHRAPDGTIDVQAGPVVPPSDPR
ncbi:MAG: L-aspartate oxidase [Planctomycetes bacterium]|nr:L-aspartate oxidase [Planctomycetota bacterium]